MRALVVGASGAVGEAAAHALRAQGWDVCATMRRRDHAAAQRLDAAGAEVAALDLASPDRLAALTADCDAAVFAVHLELTMAALAHAHAPARVLAFSSNNVAVDPASATYRALAEAEAAVRAARPDAILIRPTLIYGDPRLPTLARLMRLARRSPILPVPGSGRARVQPVFHADLGRLAGGLLARDAAGGVYAAGGPDVLAYRALYAAISRAAGAHNLVIGVARPVLRLGRALAGRAFPLSREQIERADVDRLAAPVDPVPPDLVPATPLAAGLAALANSLGAAR